jgi:hypothetical protein
MAKGRMLAAALAVSTCDRARGCLRALTVLAGLSPHRQERVRMPQPAVERPVNRRLPALSGVGPVFAEVARVTSRKPPRLRPLLT